MLLYLTVLTNKYIIRTRTFQPLYKIRNVLNFKNICVIMKKIKLELDTHL